MAFLYDGWWVTSKQQGMAVDILGELIEETLISEHGTTSFDQRKKHAAGSGSKSSARPGLDDDSSAPAGGSSKKSRLEKQGS